MPLLIVISGLLINIIIVFVINTRGKGKLAVSALEGARSREWCCWVAAALGGLILKETSNFPDVLRPTTEFEIVQETVSRAIFVTTMYSLHILLFSTAQKCRNG